MWESGRGFLKYRNKEPLVPDVWGCWGGEKIHVFVGWLVFVWFWGLIRSPAGVISGLVDLGVEVKDREGNACN